MAKDSLIFEFERDFAGTLRCIPMAVRLKLDRCGIKVSLKQWSRFTREERAELLGRSCDTPEATQSYAQYLAGLIETRANQPVEYLGPASTVEWDDATQVPARLVAWAESIAVRAPSVEQWARLSSLQRFALFKLTRPGHDNDNFRPAMQEFGLLG